MAIKIRQAREALSVEQYRQAKFDIMRSTVERLLHRLPGARYIQVTLTEYFDDQESA